ncbi:MAG TPA: hypothetical protein VHF05_02755 [Candidatus Paceibacterota bacterium]|nr:hypothetical protein [Candidatus Paceibacterota bacterium]
MIDYWGENLTFFVKRMIAPILEDERVEEIVVKLHEAIPRGQQHNITRLLSGLRPGDSIVTISEGNTLSFLFGGLSMEERVSKMQFVPAC